MMFDASRERASEGMRAEDGRPEPVLGMLDDLERQAEGLHLAERAVEVHELGVAQYAEVELVGRLHASTGRELRVATTDGLDLHGRLAGVGSDWLAIEDAAGTSFVSLSCLALVLGLADGALPEAARPIEARLSLRAVLRRLAAERQPSTLRLRGGRTVPGVPDRVGADFVELAGPESAHPLVVPLAVIAVVQESGGRR
jgi:hypothetical protein